MEREGHDSLGGKSGTYGDEGHAHHKWDSQHSFGGLVACYGPAACAAITTRDGDITNNPAGCG